MSHLFFARTKKAFHSSSGLGFLLMGFVQSVSALWMLKTGRFFLQYSSKLYFLIRHFLQYFLNALSLCPIRQVFFINVFPV